MEWKIGRQKIEAKEAKVMSDYIVLPFLTIVTLISIIRITGINSYQQTFYTVMEFGMGIDPSTNFALVNPMRRDCPPGYKKRYLEPSKRCKDQFTVGTGMNR